MSRYELNLWQSWFVDKWQQLPTISWFSVFFWLTVVRVIFVFGLLLLSLLKRPSWVELQCQSKLSQCWSVLSISRWPLLSHHSCYYFFWNVTKNHYYCLCGVCRSLQAVLTGWCATACKQPCWLCWSSCMETTALCQKSSLRDLRLDLVTQFRPSARMLLSKVLV